MSEPALQRLHETAAVPSIDLKEYREKQFNPVLQKWTKKNEVFLKSMRANRMIDAVIDEIDQRKIRIGSDWLIDFASCNYLGFDLDPEIQEEVPRYLRAWGTHPSWSRMLGSPVLYEKIEERLIDLLRVEDCLLLPNLSMINLYSLFLLSQGGEIFLDKYSHCTLYEGGTWARGLGTVLTPFDSHDPKELETRLQKSAARQKLICIDGVYSMHGKYADIPRMAALARKHNALLYIDDAHGFGVIGERGPEETSPYGKKGNSIVNYYGETYDHVVMIAGLSKAYSSYMAMITCTHELKQYLKAMIPSYLYSGPVPIASLATALKGLEVNAKRGDAIRAKLYRLSKKLSDAIKALGLRNENDTHFPIFNIYLKQEDDFDRMSKWLFEQKLYVTLCPYPMVSRQDTGFRIQVTAANTEQEIDYLTDKIKELSRTIELQMSTAV